MDKVVDSLSNGYQDFVIAAANVLEAKAKEDPNAVKFTTRDTALENFKLKWNMFKVACDQAEEFVDSVKQRMEMKCQMDEVIRRVAPIQATATSLPPVTKKEE